MNVAGCPARAAGDAAGIAVAAQPRNQGLDTRRVSRRGDRRDHIPVDDGLHSRALDINDRRFAGDRDGLFERADSKLDADRGDEVTTQLDAFTFDGVETRKRERQRVGAGAKIDDAILTGVVADDRARALDQDGTCGFNRDTRQHGAGRIPDHAGDGGLRERSRGQKQDHQERRHRSPRENTHRVPPPLAFPGKTGHVMDRMSAGTRDEGRRRRYEWGGIPR